VLAIYEHSQFGRLSHGPAVGAGSKVTASSSARTTLMIFPTSAPRCPRSNWLSQRRETCAFPARSACVRPRSRRARRTSCPSCPTVRMGREACGPMPSP